MKIKGEFVHIKRVKLPPPEDGVHVVGKSGHIKGSHSVWLGSKLVPKGSTGFYYQINDKKGVKVLYSLSWYMPIKAALVKKEYRILKKLAKTGICPQVHGIEKISLHCKWQGKRVRGKALGIVVDHICYPYDAWKAYAQGYPYDWGAVREENHNPEGFLRARKVFRARMRDLMIDSDSSMKLGDILYCTRRKQWFLCDVM